MIKHNDILIDQGNVMIPAKLVLSGEVSHEDIIRACRLSLSPEVAAAKGVGGSFKSIPQFLDWVENMSVGVKIHKRIPILEWFDLKEACHKRDGYKCVMCGAEEELECDHILPLSVGGSNGLDNLRTLCQECHGKETLALHQKLKFQRILNEEREMRKLCAEKSVMEKPVDSWRW